jgi:hypothetical protein
MRNHLDRRWGRHRTHLSHPRHADPSQPEITIWARHHPMLHDLCGCGTGTTMVVFGRTFFARLLVFRLWRVPIRFDTLRGRRLLLFPFLDAGQSQAQEHLRLALVSQCLAEDVSPCLVFHSTVGDFFLVCHDVSVSERSNLNTYGWGEGPTPPRKWADGSARSSERGGVSRRECGNCLCGQARIGALRASSRSRCRLPGDHEVCGPTNDGGGGCASDGCVGSNVWAPACATTRHPGEWGQMDREPGPGAVSRSHPDRGRIATRACLGRRTGGLRDRLTS